MPVAQGRGTSLSLVKSPFVKLVLGRPADSILMDVYKDRILPHLPPH